MHEAVVCIGSNIAAAGNEVEKALQWLATLFSELRHTPPYLTEPEGEAAGEAPYLNAVATGLTALTPAELNIMFKRYEQSRGRQPAHKARSHIIIDIDLVCHNGTIINPAEFNARYFHKGYNSLTGCHC